MKDEVKAVDEFLDGLDKVGDEPFETKAEDPFATVEKPEEKKEEVVVEKEEKPVPFHKDPKVLRFIEKEVEKRASQFKPAETQHIENTDGDGIDEVLTRIIGNDTPEKLSAIKDFKKVLIEREERGAEKALQRLQEEREREEEAEREAQEELTQGFENIEETFNVDLTSASAKKTREEFVDFITKIAPKNDEGQVVAFPDLVNAYEMFQERKKVATPTNNRAKELASRSMTRSADASAAPTTGKSWKDVDKLFDKLSG